MSELTEKLKEAILSILPISSVMILSSIILGFNIQTIVSILFSTVLLIISLLLH